MLKTLIIANYLFVICFNSPTFALPKKFFIEIIRWEFRNSPEYVILRLVEER